MESRIAHASGAGRLNRRLNRQYARAKWLVRYSRLLLFFNNKVPACRAHKHNRVKFASFSIMHIRSKQSLERNCEREDDLHVSNLRERRNLVAVLKLNAQIFNKIS